MAKTVIFDSYTPVSVTMKFNESINYGTDETPNIMATGIVRSVIKSIGDDGTEKYFVKEWDIRPNNPYGLPEINSEQKAYIINIIKEAWQDVANEFISVDSEFTALDDLIR